MSVSSRASSLQAYNLVLYRTALHPEFFGIEGRQRIAHGDYEFEGWIFRGGHSARFEYNGFCVTEVVSEHVESLPDRGLVTALPCAGERDHEQEFAERLVYVASMQTEMLSDHLYQGTYRDLVDHGRRNGGPMSLWQDELGRPNLSLLEVQRYRDQVHVQSYHCRSDCGLVLRTQSIFQVKGK